MRRIALTGGIATGKSTILRRLQRHGVRVIDADALAREAIAPGTAAAAAVRARFGDALFGPDGTLDRKALGALIFGDEEARAALERIVHPEVYGRIAAWFAALPAGTSLAVADIPLLFETGHDTEFDTVIVAACPPDVQLERIRRRDGFSDGEARARLAAQWPIAEKMRRADYVVRTDGPVEATDAQVDALLATLST
jgi:dephospho-CoA kinase